MVFTTFNVACPEASSGALPKRRTMRAEITRPLRDTATCTVTHLAVALTWPPAGQLSESDVTDALVRAQPPHLLPEFTQAAFGQFLVRCVEGLPVLLAASFEERIVSPEVLSR